MATALIPPLAWEPQYAMGAALEKQNKTKQKSKSAMASNPTAGHQDFNQILLGTCNIVVKGFGVSCQSSGSGNGSTIYYFRDSGKDN